MRKAAQTLVNLGLPIALHELRDKTGQQVAQRLHFPGLVPGVAKELLPEDKVRALETLAGKYAQAAM